MKTIAENANDFADLRTVAMLYQTGYLTIKDYRCGRYLLGVPDEEVRRDLLLLIGLAFDSKTRQLADAAWERGTAL